jgi:hypothetical protein
MSFHKSCMDDPHLVHFTKFDCIAILLRCTMEVL